MSGQIQTLATPPPVSVQTLLYNIYLAAASGGSGGASCGSITGTNPHSVTKAQVGLGNCDNTSDADKPISTATQTALDGKASTSHTHSDATTSAAGFMSAADKLKLDGVEAAADVTDAGNVGSAIHGATGKTTPVDADTLPLIDSAASNVLKKLTWANIKATLKTYFDAIYLVKTVYDPQNAGRISGADGVDEVLYGGASGGTGGTLSMDGGNASSFMETAIAAGNAGSINTSGGSADGAQTGGAGGSINTSGSPGLSGGSINTTAGGSITSGSGNVNLGNTSGTLDPHALSPLPAVAVELGYACSDETTALTTGTAKITVRVPYAFTVTGVFASVTTAPVGSTLIVDINEAGTSILSTKLSIDAGEKSSNTASSAAVVSDASIAAYAEITIDIDQIGSSTAGAGLKVWILGVRA